MTECEDRDSVKLCSRHITDTVLIYDEGAVQVLKINDAGDDFVVKALCSQKHYVEVARIWWCVAKIAVAMENLFIVSETHKNIQGLCLFV